ncbi:hypothetical protein ABW20_dc0101910 [Dactylellina cionopaga]|nr:hypothetical protein ABW20_dc0101910 [Dactylellina cionopaga]
MRTPIFLGSLILESTLNLALGFSQPGGSRRQTITTTIVIYETVRNSETIVRVLDVRSQAALPRCDIVWTSWYFSQNSSSTSSLASTTNASPSIPSSTFVLQQGDGAQGEATNYILFQNAGAGILLGPLGIPGTRLANLALTSDGLLLNSLDPSQFVFVRPNITAGTSRKRQDGAGNFDYGIVLTGNEKSTTTSDVNSGYAFNASDALRLQYKSSFYDFYSSSGKNENGLSDLYMAREGAEKMDPSLQSLDLRGVDANSVTKSATGTGTDNASTSSTSTSTSFSSKNATTNTSRTSRSSGTSGTSSNSQSESNATTTSTTSVNSTSTPTSSFTTPTSTSNSSQDSQSRHSSSSSVDVTLKIYSIITYFGYQSYCSDLLDSTTTFNVLANTTTPGTYTANSVSNTTTTTTTTSILEFTASNGTSYSATTVAETVPTLRKRRPRDCVTTDGTEGFKRHELQNVRRDPAVPSQLSSFQPSDIASGCLKAIVPAVITNTGTSYTSTIVDLVATEYTIIDTLTSISTSTTSTSTTATVPETTYTYPGAGKVYLVEQQPKFSLGTLSSYGNYNILGAINQLQYTGGIHPQSDWVVIYNATDDSWYWAYGYTDTFMGTAVVRKRNPSTSVLADWRLGF